MGNVVQIYPSNSFDVVCDNAKKEIECGIIIGYDADGVMCVYGGGLIDGRQPVARDWLWLVSSFQQGLICGNFSAT